MSGGQALVPSGVLGGGVLKADDYADFLAREYLAAYLPGGGAAVKVAVVGDGGAADRLESALAAAAAEHGGVGREHFGGDHPGAYGRPDLFRDLPGGRLGGTRGRPCAGCLSRCGVSGARREPASR